MLFPSVRLLRWGGAAVVAALAVIVFPNAYLVLVAFDVVVVLAVLLDLSLTPGANVLEVFRTAPERMSALAEHPVAVRVVNRAGARLKIRIRDRAPDSFRSSAGELAGIVPARGETRWEYRVTPLTRGRFQWGPIRLRYRSLLGFWERQKEVTAAAEARVYPSLHLLQRYRLLALTNKFALLGSRKVRLRGGAWEFESLREYVPGDDTRLLDWKASARRRKPIVRDLEAERNQTVLILVDSGRLMNAEVDGIAKLDHAVNSALVLAHVALSRGDRVGLCAFSSTVHAWVTPRAHVAQMGLLTEALYDLRGDYTESDHGRCLRFVAARHSKRSLLVVLTDFVDADTAADMVAHLQLAGRRHLVLFAAHNDPVLERHARGVPSTARDGFRKAAAVDLLLERRTVLERLRQFGAHVLDVEPDRITPPLLNRYLEIASRGML